MICKNDKVPKLKKQLSRRKLIANFRETSLNVVLNLLLSLIHVTPNFSSSETEINSFLIFFVFGFVFFALLIVWNICVESREVIIAIESALLLTLTLLIA